MLIYSYISSVIFPARWFRFCNKTKSVIKYKNSALTIALFARGINIDQEFSQTVSAQVLNNELLSGILPKIEPFRTRLVWFWYLANLCIYRLCSGLGAGGIGEGYIQVPFVRKFYSTNFSNHNFLLNIAYKYCKYWILRYIFRFSIFSFQNILIHFHIIFQYGTIPTGTKTMIKLCWSLKPFSRLGPYKSI